MSENMSNELTHFEQCKLDEANGPTGSSDKDKCDRARLLERRIKAERAQAAASVAPLTPAELKREALEADLAGLKPLSAFASAESKCARAAKIEAIYRKHGAK